MYLTLVGNDDLWKVVNREIVWPHLCLKWNKWRMNEWMKEAVSSRLWSEELFGERIRQR